MAVSCDPPNHDHDEREEANRDRAVNEAVEILRPHFDSLLILGTHLTEDGATATHIERFGNYFAQIGLARHFLDKRRADAEIEASEQHDERD